MAMMHLSEELFKRAEPIREDSIDEKWKWFKIMEADGTSKGKQRQWTVKEYNMLVDALLTLHEEGCLVSDNGFKSGVLSQLQKMLHEKAPGCGIKAEPHIKSRLKTLKQNWQAMYDMVTGTNTYGFGWDPDSHCVTAEKDVWDDYLKSNKKTSHLRGKVFPHFDALCTIYAKDKASGKESIAGLKDQVDESDIPPPIDVENHDENADLGAEEVNPPIPFIVEEVNATPTTSKKRKRNNSDRDELFLDGLGKMMNTATQGIQEASVALGTQIGKLGRAAILDAKRESLYDELCKLEELSPKEQHDVLFKIVINENILAVFSSLPYEAKLEMVRRVLAA